MQHFESNCVTITMLAYCEIPEVIGVRISKKGVVVCPVLQFWLSEGCPGLNPQFGDGVNMAVYWPC